MNIIPRKDDKIIIVSGNTCIFEAVCITDFINGVNHINIQNMLSARQTWVKI